MHVGIDLIEIERIATALVRHPRLRERVYTDAERTYCESKVNPAESYAARLGNSRQLPDHTFRRQVRIESARRRGDKFRWNGSGGLRIFRLQVLEIVVDTILQLLRCRAEVGAA